ncbi:pyridoxal biosynthesis protein PDX2-like protein [Dunaliella salina]|uniref:glutaminase n=1 Tax=Dunaliella salina TaxID=3046 RepID=A0ABQ7GHJ0_DUNSA|nr:pyridoxal biosynthesis protein PDX2-like protein [Dunaliella salina]|eukprot:KAF5834067.1 pyridoxal biosynthesis protein PDX2-like protein [Dunaliella salina]
MVAIGVLALQGSFREHAALLRRLPGVSVVEVRTPEELMSVQGLVIPGGESTTMALVAERWGLIPLLRDFLSSGKPIWGTCAGMIFLAERAEGTKSGGQALLGGLDIAVSRNFFGAQINSFETQLGAPECLRKFGGEDVFRAVFIRAPAVLQTGSGVEELAHYTLTEQEKDPAERLLHFVCVPLLCLCLTSTGGCGRLWVCVSFHQEPTSDLQWHQLFADMVFAHAGQTAVEQQAIQSSQDALTGRTPARPADLPVYGKQHLALAQ